MLLDILNTYRLRLPLGGHPSVLSGHVSSTVHVPHPSQSLYVKLTIPVLVSEQSMIVMYMYVVIQTMNSYWNATMDLTVINDNG